jgi:hypothetical protein
MKEQTRMRQIRRLLPFALTVAAFLVAVVFARVQTKQVKVAPLDNQVRWHANAAKKENKTKITIPAWNRLEAEPIVEDVVTRFTVLVAVLEQKRSYESSDGNQLTTWNKLKILDTVSAPKETITDESSKPPQELFPLNRGEILIQTAGGTSVIDGVEITQPGPELNKGQKYLLYVILNPSGVAALPHGRAGIFEVEQNGALKAFSKGGFQLGESVDSVKTELKKRHERSN